MIRLKRLYLCNPSDPAGGLATSVDLSQETFLITFLFFLPNFFQIFLFFFQEIFAETSRQKLITSSLFIFTLLPIYMSFIMNNSYVLLLVLYNFCRLVSAKISSNFFIFPSKIFFRSFYFFPRNLRRDKLTLFIQIIHILFILLPYYISKEYHFLRPSVTPPEASNFCRQTFLSNFPKIFLLTFQDFFAETIPL
jgi:hypothetical protein